jgi:hypothetical protein
MKDARFWAQTYLAHLGRHYDAAVRVREKTVAWFGMQYDGASYVGFVDEAQGSIFLKRSVYLDASILDAALSAVLEHPAKHSIDVTKDFDDTALSWYVNFIPTPPEEYAKLFEAVRGLVDEAYTAGVELISSDEFLMRALSKHR